MSYCFVVTSLSLFDDNRHSMWESRMPAVELRIGCGIAPDRCIGEGSSVDNRIEPTMLRAGSQNLNPIEL